MDILVCIDDTDDLESRGTGELASMLADHVERSGWGSVSYVTRHQLFVHPDIPYTSHNSAMCFTACLDAARLDELIADASDVLATEAAVGSDPGLCVAVVDRIADPPALVAFGERAKREICTKAEAYELARHLGVHLSEHGGTGQGVIGALAGAGLRLGGNDGRLKGSIGFADAGRPLPVATLRAHRCIDAVRAKDGAALADDELVRLVDKVKTVLLGGKAVLLVAEAPEPVDGVRWQTCSRKELKAY